MFSDDFMICEVLSIQEVLVKDVFWSQTIY